ncbi:MAG TPA: MarC family protein [Gemmatimonadaceae bacterium]|nr:MarC family protein [Gemmatimonadaceae bacterium]
MISDFQPSPADPFSPGKVFTFLFVMIGPLKVIGPFAKMTAGWDRGVKRRLAFQAIVIAAIGAFAAATIGSSLLQKWGISLGALLLTTGIVLFLVAMRVVMEQYEPHVQAAETGDRSAVAQPASATALAFSPLAFPTIITPYGAALLILLMSLRSGQTAVVVKIGAITVLVLVLDLVAMLTADRILTTPAVRPALGILGSVLSVLQVALGAQAIIEALRLLGVPALTSG